MPHHIAQVRFPVDRLILFAEFNQTNESPDSMSLVTGYYHTRLHRDKAAVYEHWKSLNDADCYCGRDEDVELATNAGDGHSVPGRACRHCLAITFDPLPDPDLDRTIVKVGLPWWWVKS